MLYTMEKIPSNNENEVFNTNDGLPEITDLDDYEHKVGEQGIRTYNIDGINVNVDWMRFLPETNNGEIIKPFEKGVLYFNGWSMPSDAKSSEILVKTLAQETVKDGGSLAMSISTRAENISESSLPTEAKAIIELIKEIGLKEVVLAGHSKGGQKAANVVAQIQRNEPDIKVDGLLLFCPVGLYEQGNLELTRKFWGHAFTQSLKAQSNREMASTYDSLTKDISKEMIDEIKKSKLDYPKRVISEIAEMAKMDSAFSEVECPVILIQGQNDPVSSPEKTTESVLKVENDTFSINQNELLGKIFPKSPYVRWVKGKKSKERLGGHTLPNYRPRAVARVASYLTRRYERELSQDS